MPRSRWPLAQDAMWVRKQQQETQHTWPGRVSRSLGIFHLKHTAWNFYIHSKWRHCCTRGGKKKVTAFTKHLHHSRDPPHQILVTQSPAKEGAANTGGKSKINNNHHHIKNTQRTEQDSWTEKWIQCCLPVATEGVTTSLPLKRDFSQVAMQDKMC